MVKQQRISYHTYYLFSNDQSKENEREEKAYFELPVH